VRPVLWGAAYSVYTRTARLALIEKGVGYAFRELDIFADAVPADYLVRHPFKRIPALEQGDFSLYETAAITRYVDEAFDGPPLQPADVRARARMAQIVGMVDSYVYWPAVRVVYVQRVGRPREGAAPDEAAIAEALPRVATALDALEALAGGDGFLVGGALSLADLQLAPMIDYFARAPEGRAMLDARPKLAAWWQAIQGRDSLAATPFAPR
jgi:glutathione S-transferase